MRTFRLFTGFFLLLASLILVFRLAPAEPDASAQSQGRIPILPRTPIGVTSPEMPEKLQPDNLTAKIDGILDRSGFSPSKSRLSIKIVSIPDGRVLYERNPDLALNPASNVKLVTMATALKELGPSFTFKTGFFSDSLIDREGRIQNLWIKGQGDPLFVNEQLASVVGRLKAAGLKKIEGKVFVDDTYFDRYNLTTYIADVNEKLYSIITGPLSFNFNSIRIRARPGRRAGERPRITVEAPADFVRVENEAKTAAIGVAPDLDADVRETKKKDSNVIRIRGFMPRAVREFTFQRGVPDPAIYTGRMIVDALQRAGIKVSSTIRREAVPPNALLLLTHSSPPLIEILRSLGKFSNNFTAEQLVKGIAADRFGPPGSTPKGLSLLRAYLESLGIPRREFVLDNGSGLTRLSRISASHFIRVLFDLYASPWREGFISSLSIAGRDGTMARKLTGGRVRGKVFAKTGTLNGVSALSGYLFDTKCQLAFSFVFNDFNTSLQTIARTEEDILEAVLDTY